MMLSSELWRRGQAVAVLGFAVFDVGGTAAGVESERRVLVRHQEDVAGDPVHPAVQADDEVEQIAGTPVGAQGAVRVERDPPAPAQYTRVELEDRVRVAAGEDVAIAP
jgi:hypothetical protein